MHLNFAVDKVDLLCVELLTQQFNIRVKDVTVTLHDNLVYLLLINVVLVSEMSKSLLWILMQQTRFDLGARVADVTFTTARSFIRFAKTADFAPSTHLQGFTKVS